MNNRGMKALVVAFATAALIMTAASAHADVKCRSTVSKESAKLTQSIAKILQKCEQSIEDGKFAGPCPDTKSGDKIASSKAKMVAAIVKTCATSTGEFAFGRCPNETGTTGSNCGNLLVQDKTGEGNCLACLADHNAKELVQRVLYGPLLVPASDDIKKCQTAINKNTVAFYTSASKTLAKCQGSLLKGKVTSCPDQKTTEALQKAEDKKVAAITKACCGDDGACGGATCSIGSPLKVVCQGGANNGVACANDTACPGGYCASAADEQRCSGGANDGQPCTNTTECPSGTCPARGAAVCEASSDCGRCQGSTSPGKPCRSNGQCDQDPGNCNSSLHKCVAGSNPGTACTFPAGPECLGGGNCSSGVCTGGTNNNNACSTALRCVGGANAGASCAVASECPGGACNGNFDCPSVPAGTCVGLTGLCGGSDDFNPITDIGVITPSCPGISLGGAPLKLMGVTVNSILACADPQADLRSQCQDAAGATFGYNGSVPPFCVDTPVDCAPSGPTHTATVVVTNTTTMDLAAVSVNLGYKGVNFPGTGEVTGSPLITSTHGGAVANDNDDSMTLSVTDLGTPIATGNLFTVTFSDCGAVPTTANYGCVVRSASDGVGTDIQDGVSCSVTVP